MRKDQADNIKERIYWIDKKIAQLKTKRSKLVEKLNDSGIIFT